MPVRSGRFEKRIRLAIPVQISDPLDPVATERATTENFCSKGIRILAEQARDQNERLIITAPADDLRASARVVYCQKVQDGRYALGLQFERLAGDWSVTLSRAG